MLARASAAVQLTVVVAIANVVALAGVHVAATVPLTASIALAAYVTIAPAALVASTVAFDGTVMAGGVVSRTVTVNDPDAAFPRASAAVQFTGVAPSGNVVPVAGRHVATTLPFTASTALAV